MDYTSTEIAIKIIKKHMKLLDDKMNENYADRDAGGERSYKFDEICQTYNHLESTLEYLTDLED